jgi:hypothetical protein
MYVYGWLSGENAGGIVPVDMIYFKVLLLHWCHTSVNYCYTVVTFLLHCLYTVLTVI